MARLMALLLLILLTLVSVAGYIFIDQSITVGNIKIAEGIRQLEIGHPELEKGRVRMEAGRQELMEGQEKYKRAGKNLFLVLADRLLKGGEGFRDARKRIEEGLEQISMGEVEFKAGKKRIDEGELELLKGREQLKQAENLRIFFAVAASFSASLAVLFGFFWRRSLSRLV